MDRVTVKALLTEAALQRMPQGDLRFCPDADCDVVYFDADGVSFATTDVRVPVWQKLPFGARQVCYCFGESEASIRTELELTGASSATARIRDHIAAGRCACDVRNPRGACCLGDVIAATERVKAARRVDGVQDLTAEDAKGKAEVTSDPAKASPAAIAPVMTTRSAFTVEPLPPPGEKAVVKGD